SCFPLFFFFQAEDGIRDLTVTGVQTCALPILKFHEPDATSLSLPLGGAFDAAGNMWVVDAGNNRVLAYPANGSFNYTAATVVVRSEERRVGKECRYRWSRDH